jgi:hypothetical protein
MPVKVHRMPPSGCKKTDDWNSEPHVHERLLSDNNKSDELNSKSYGRFVLSLLLAIFCLVFMVNSCNGYHNKDYDSNTISITSNIS